VTVAAILLAQPGIGSIGGVEPGNVINREEAVATMFAIADLNANVERIVQLLEGESDGNEGLSEEDS
jgi:hypothetical protein